MRSLPFGLRTHVALAAPAAACVAPAILADSLGGMHRDALFLMLTSVGGVVALVALALVVVAWVRRGSPFPSAAPQGSAFETALTGLTGACLGAYAGVMQDAYVHLSAMVASFGMLPLALLVCCPRRPVWRPFVDVSALMAGFEVFAQLGLMLTKWHALRWWDDVTGMSLLWWGGGLAAAAFWTFAQRRGLSFHEILRIRLAVEDGERPPPRKRT